MRSLFGLLLLWLAGCASIVAEHPMTPRRIPHSNREAAFTAVLGAVASSRAEIAVADRSSGIISTMWCETHRSMTPLVTCVPVVAVDISDVRRLALVVQSFEAEITIEPRVERCFQGDCRQVPKMSDEERKIVDFVESYTRARILDPKAPAPDPAPDEVGPGKRVVIIKKNGFKLRGTLLEQGEDGAIVLEVQNFEGKSKQRVAAEEIESVTADE